MQNLPVETDQLRVVACPHPFKAAHQEYFLAPTLSLTQILQEVQPDVLLRRRAHIWVNDQYIPPEQWDFTFPEPGSVIAIRVVPSGGIGRIIGMVVLAIVSVVAAVLTLGTLTPLIGAMWAGVAAGVVGLAVGVVGNLALNALFPPVKPGGAGTLGALSATPSLDYGQSSPTLSITGAQNKANLWGPVPFILGKFRVAPYFGARSYTESVGSDQYLRLPFVWGFGPVQLEDLRILDTGLEYYQGVEVEHRNLTLRLNPGTIAIDVTAKTLTRTYGSWLMDGINAGNTITLEGCTTPANDTDYLITAAAPQVLVYSTSSATTTEAGNGAQVGSVTFGDQPVTLYPESISEAALSIELDQSVQNIHTSGEDADEISLDIACSSLMGITSGGGTYDMTVAFEVYARLTGSGDSWTMINRTLVIPGTPATPGTPPIVTYSPLGFAWFGGIQSTSTPGTAGTSGSPDVYGSLVLTGNTKSAVRGNIGWKTPVRGQYDVMVIRITPPDTIWTSSVSYWVALRTIKNVDPINFPFPLAKTVMRIKATGQLNGTVEEFKGTITAICPDWDADTSTWITRPTTNPASLYRQVLQGVQNQKPVADSRINLDKLQYWHAYCETQGWKYHKYIDYTATVEDLLREIAAAARSAYARIDSKVGVIIDEPQDFTVGPAFTPRNILKDSFQGNITIIDRPHAFRCPFINQAMQYQQDERLVLADGYQIDGKDAWGVSHPEYPGATIFEQLDLPGITDPELIFRQARYHGAVAKLRCETTQFGTDMEWLVATRGDRIKFAHDTMLTGLSWGRVKELVYDETGAVSGVTTDELLPMEAEKSYVLRFRLANNTSLLCPIVTAAGEPTAATFVTPIVSGDDWPAVGDLFLFGEADLEAIDLIIKSIQPNSDLSATVITLPYDENIYLADVGTVPEHDPKISAPVEWWTPDISWIRSDGTVLFPIPGGGWQSRILVSLLRPSALDSQITGVEAQFWVTGSGGTPVTLPVVDLDSGEVSIIPVTDGQSYDFRLRYVKKDGSQGPWGDIETHVVEGKTAPPENVTGFAVYQAKEVITFIWTKNPDRDIRGYEIRYGLRSNPGSGPGYFSPEGAGLFVDPFFGEPGISNLESSWEDGIKITEVAMGTNFTTTMIPPDTWVFMIKAIDTSGNYSALEAHKVLRIMQFYQILQEPKSAPLWPGTLINMVRDPLTSQLYPMSQADSAADDLEMFDHFVTEPFDTYGYESPEIDLFSDLAARAWGRIYSDLGPAESGVNDPEMQFDYREDGGAYGGFEPWAIGAFLGRYGKFKVINTAATGNLWLSDFQLVIDRTY